MLKIKWYRFCWNLFGFFMNRAYQFQVLEPFRTIAITPHWEGSIKRYLKAWVAHQFFKIASVFCLSDAQFKMAYSLPEDD